jgi:hypothetical protein
MFPEYAKWGDSNLCLNFNDLLFSSRFTRTKIILKRMARLNSTGTSSGALPFCTQAYQLKDIPFLSFQVLTSVTSKFDHVSCVGCIYDAVSLRLHNLEW